MDQQDFLTLLMWTSKHDDQVDALGVIGQMLAMFMPGRRPPGRKAKRYPQDDGYRVMETERDLRSWLAGESEHNWLVADEREGLDWKAM